MAAADAEAQRGEMRDRWEQTAAGWERRAERVRETGMPVSVWMIEQLGLQPGQRVLELAAGPGDTGFLAAELIRPGGTLVTSDGAEAMLSVARRRAQELGIENVEFRRLELEWIDLPTASVDSVLCRWGVMLTVDPDTSVREMRRVLRPGGRVALAVWDAAERNPWATIPTRALIEGGHASPSDPAGPGMFALAAEGRLRRLLEDVGFVEVVVETVEMARRYASVEDYVRETLDLSLAFADVFQGLLEDRQAEVATDIARLAQPFLSGQGALRLPGRALVVAGEA